MTFLSEDYRRLTEHITSMPEEQAAYILCGISRSDREIRFLVREIVLVPKEILLRQEEDLISIPSSSYMPVLKHAADTNQCFFLIHSHPSHIPSFSRADDIEEPKLIKTAYVRAEKGMHGSMVYSNDAISARVWLEEGDTLYSEPINLIRIIGKQYEFKIPYNAPISPNIIPIKFFDRQVRAFGKDLQKLLGQLHIGVVGCGGTGSAVVEQLVRLGIGSLVLIDDDLIEDTNISRIHGSIMEDQGRYKVHVMEKMVKQIGYGTKVEAIAKKILDKSTALKLRECDLIFGCTDDHAGRSIINDLSIRYFIPVIDMAALIDSQDGRIRSVIGRVTVIKPKEPCLLCRNRISPEKIKSEMMALWDPNMYERRVQEGYSPELGIKDPAVITFTTSVASQAVMEMIQLLTGYMGRENNATEFLCLYDDRDIRKLGSKQQFSCKCNNPEICGRGDHQEFLGMIWPPRDKEL
ncbi:MAG: hypothetical protein VR68_00860 [Peptococcaceae bacterium BRH_c4a]|nr:MAG: hypothetical protein VR68_00860 [Peptococcaceae bacterium BRH_c4a]